MADTICSHGDDWYLRKTTSPGEKCVSANAPAKYSKCLGDLRNTGVSHTNSETTKPAPYFRRKDKTSTRTRPHVECNEWPEHCEQKEI